MNISQAEADHLLMLPKRFETGVTLIELPRQISDITRTFLTTP